MFSKMITEGREGVKKGSKSDNIIVAEESFKMKQSVLLQYSMN